MVSTVAQAARAYEEYSREWASTPPRTNVQVQRGMRSERAVAAQESLSPSVWSLFKCGVVLSVVLAAFALVHVSLDTATVSLSLEAQAISTQITDARHEANLLEVQASSLSNPARIKSAAAELGMSVPSNPTVIYLSKDIVVTDASGNLSLAGSARVVADAALAG